MSKISVLHLIAGNLGGGAARGAYSLHRGLLANGIYSRVLSDCSDSAFDETVFSIAKDTKGKLARAVRSRLDGVATRLYPKRNKINFSTGFAGYDFTKTAAYAKATIIHLHWINGGLVKMRDLQKISKPVVWTLRDMWPMTGGCHYAMACENYAFGCGACPQLGSASKLDLSRIVNKSKQRSIPKSTVVIGISNWLSTRARESAIFKWHDVRTISNNIDTQEFFPVDKLMARKALGIQTEKKIIVTGAQSINDCFKGFDKFVQAVSHLKKKEEYHLCFFGNINCELLTRLGFSFNAFGFLHDAISLRLAYSAADVFVSPSIAEAFGKTVAEAMACGTPAVCFDDTGATDIVDHKVNGYCAKPFESEDLAHGIEWVAQYRDINQLTQAGRAKIVNSFDVDVIAKQYISLYQELVN